MQSIVKILQRVVTLIAVVLLCASCKNAYLPSLGSSPWKVVQLPTEATIQDVAFTGDRDRGWLVGSNATLLETNDGGDTWEPRYLDLDSEMTRLTSISFSGDEGWMVGMPSIMLHTTDGGSSWSEIPLSNKLPGTTKTILALGPDAAEMTTDLGAIYRTEDGGRNWKAMVQSAVGVYRNISRSSDGQYVTVSANGNFYSTWEPGQDAWVQHNRNNSKRLQKMGFTADNRLWLLARGGVLQFSNTVNPETPEDWQESQQPEFASSIGFLDLSYRTPEEIWVAGGSGNLLVSFDGGETWEKDRTVEDVPANFYQIDFETPESGFAIGNGGVLLKYELNSEKPTA
ncbi:photosynthesis system II assembly factor Ycf48 [Roseofilum casamattae]|uniref:Photosystem II assembly protein Ycf48 n=1 Tax=Roseofilum casamattae BLCC-M143 TaxID=3022442 RepID=A0ABT7BXZ0_9CYAN|nr:photosynthesis system II assembly factor Ycf48 [Roseofilum casamattae]MDJ1184067.1 photosynthesis system II assembly factor Ycf48 [Roseofilum casamattae BLCC-M143]